ISEIKKTGPRPPHPTGQNTYPAGSIRQRILEAAFNLFSESGFSPTSMLNIVTRARVSKRDLYALFRNKHAVLAACIHEALSICAAPWTPQFRYHSSRCPGKIVNRVRCIHAENGV